jgi:asparagine synthase (glutamine-hydrolysing)
MPGITGIITDRRSGQNACLLERMVGCMVREPADPHGTYLNEGLGLGSGWVGSISSSSDDIPSWNRNRDIGLLFAGETYGDNDQVGQRDEGRKGDFGQGGRLVELYEKHGVAFLQKLNGWFGGMLVDLRESKVIIFNDRYGLGRICYHENADGFYFATEAKSLLKVLPEVRQLNLQSLGEFFSCGSVLQNRTLFSGISLLPGGSAWTFVPGQAVRKISYFERSLWERQPILSGPAYYETLKETWARVLPRYLRSVGNTALSLTGGVDSRMILAWARCEPGALPCYTFGGRYRDCRDVKISREVAGISRQPHHVIRVGQEFLREFPSLAERTVFISDGSMDVTGSIDLFVQRRAREIAPVRVTGTNGGEMLRRLVAFKPMPFHEDFLPPEIRRQVREADLTYKKEREGHKLSFTAFKQTPWHMCSKFAVERSQLTLRMPYFDNDLVALSYQAPPDLAECNAPALRLIAEGNPALGAIGTDRGLTARTIPGFTKARHSLQEFTFKAEYAYDYGMPQWLAALDSLFKPLHFERLFLGRHKFHHFRTFYRDELAPYIKEVLLDSRTRNRPFLQGDRLEAMVNGHVSGYRNYTLAIHKILSIELIVRQLIEQR